MSRHRYIGLPRYKGIPIYWKPIDYSACSRIFSILVCYNWIINFYLRIFIFTNTFAITLKYLQDASAERVLTYQHNMGEAFAMLPKLQTGLDVNVKFTGYVAGGANEKVLRYEMGIRNVPFLLLDTTNMFARVFSFGTGNPHVKLEVVQSLMRKCLL